MKHYKEINKLEQLLKSKEYIQQLREYKNMINSDNN